MLEVKELKPVRRTPGLKKGSKMYSLDGMYFPFESKGAVLNYMQKNGISGTVYTGTIKGMKGDDTLSKEEERYLEDTGLHFLVYPDSIAKNQLGG